MRVEHAERMLVARDVAAQREVHLVVTASPAHDGRHRVVAHAFGALAVMRDDADRRIVPFTPCIQHAACRVEQLLTRGRTKANHRKRPLHDACLHLGETGHPERLDDRGNLHRERMPPALEVIVPENRASHDRQIGVAADEVVREQVDEIEQTGKRRPVDVHRPVLPAHRDAVLVVIGVRAIPHAPLLAADLDGARVPDLDVVVGHAQRAWTLRAGCRVDVAPFRRIRRSRCDSARILLGLRQVDGYLQVPPVGLCLPRDIARDRLDLHEPLVATGLVKLAGIEHRSSSSMRHLLGGSVSFSGRRRSTGSFPE